MTRKLRDDSASAVRRGVFGWPTIVLYILGYTPSLALAVEFMGPVDIPLVRYGYVIFMAVWGALAAVLQQFAKGRELEYWRLVVLRDLVNATLAAVLVFWACEYSKIPPLVQALSFTLAGYGGARFMEVLYALFAMAVKILGKFKE